ncbi:MAG TPA: hypothetical protein VEB59_16055 [Gemmatimonadales bacterium]|nr:hypothetical protein [Gemmatimonadales bacterium]
MLTENASTPAIPTAAMISARNPKDQASTALSRRGATLWCLICATVRTCSIGIPGARRRTMRVAAPARAATLLSARTPSPPE